MENSPSSNDNMDNDDNDPPERLTSVLPEEFELSTEALLPSRSYASEEGFFGRLSNNNNNNNSKDDNVVVVDDKRFTVDDFSDSRAATTTPLVWKSFPVRLALLGGSFLLFEPLTNALHSMILVPQLDTNFMADVTANFGAGITILYGTYVSLTLSILYQRQQNLQGKVAKESALLLICTRQVLKLVSSKKEENALPEVQATQCIADQVQTLVQSTRGEELLTMIDSDPYSRLLELLQDYEPPSPKQQLLADTCQVVHQLICTRAGRLNEEAFELPPTHFNVLTVLTLLILMNFTLSTHNVTGLTPALFFAALCTTYTMYFFFANDLRNPFDGVYQIQTSTTEAHLYQIQGLLNRRKKRSPSAAPAPAPVVKRPGESRGTALDGDRQEEEEEARFQ